MSAARANSSPVPLPTFISSRYGIDNLPPNIQHEFGSDVCHQLFSDEEALQCAAESATPANNTSSGEVECRGTSTRRLVLDPSAPGFQYESLGTILRTNVVRGCGETYDKGVTHTDFNAEIHKRRMGPPITTEYRNRKDDLTKWAEYNIIYDKQKRLWDSHKSEKDKKGSD